jgi:hypothetical protein
LVLPLLGVGLMAQTPSDSPKPKPGSAQPATLDDPLVAEAKGFIQTHLAILRIERVTEASTQVVAGRRVRLVCRVKEEDGEGLWEFVAYRRLNGRWHLQLAKRLGD